MVVFFDVKVIPFSVISDGEGFGAEVALVGMGGKGGSGVGIERK